MEEGRKEEGGEGRGGGKGREEGGVKWWGGCWDGEGEWGKVVRMNPV